MKYCGWRFDKIYSMTTHFYKTDELTASIYVVYVEIPLRFNAILNIENEDKHCFIWSLLAYLHLCNNNHPDRVSYYKQHFDDLYTIFEVLHDTTPTYRINYLPGRYNENLLLPTKLSLEQNNQVMKKLNLIQ